MTIIYQKSHADQIDTHWPHIETWVNNSLGPDKTRNVDDIKRICEKGLVDLWIVFSGTDYTGFFISLVIENPRGNVCHGAWLGGENLSFWVDGGFKVIEEYAKSIGCVAYSFIGRKAWKKMLGFDYIGEYYYKNLI